MYMYIYIYTYVHNYVYYIFIHTYIYIYILMAVLGMLDRWRITFITWHSTNPGDCCHEQLSHAACHGVVQGCGGESCGNSQELKRKLQPPIYRLFMVIWIPDLNYGHERQPAPLPVSIFCMKKRTFFAAQNSCILFMHPNLLCRDIHDCLVLPGKFACFFFLFAFFPAFESVNLGKL